MFTSSEFRDCVYYPGAGTDIQIILRTSHRTSRIIAPTLSSNLTTESALEIFKSKCAFLNRNYGCTMLEVLGVEHVKLSFDPRDRPAPTPTYMTQHELRSYWEAFGIHFTPGVSREPALSRFLFRRTVAGRSRIVEWYLLRTEGLATLQVLHQELRTVPRWIVTIQTGVLERPSSLLVRAMRALSIYPDIWVRGYWTCSAGNSDALERFDPYSHTVQDFGYYNSRLGVEVEGSEDCPCSPPLSRVKAFSRVRSVESVERTIRCDHNPRRQLTIRFGQIEELADEECIVFTGRRLCATARRTPDHLVYCWEDLTSERDPTLAPLTLPEALGRIDQITHDRHPGKRIFMTPVGYEDEIGYPVDFIRNGSADLDLTVVVKHPLDVIDSALYELS
jgi:hypothetical protein